MERFKSIRTRIKAQFIFDDGTVTSATIVRMAANGLLVDGIWLDLPTSEVVVYLPTGERFEGQAKQVARNVIGIKIKSNHARREKLIECMMREIAKDQTRMSMIPETEQRQSMRYAVNTEGAMCVLKDGSSLPCAVLDVSIDGLGIAIDHVLSLGDIVRIGKARARVIRETDIGYGLHILSPNDVDARSFENEVAALTAATAIPAARMQSVA